MKNKLIEEAISEALRAQDEPWVPAKTQRKQIRLPPALPLGDGQHVPATERLMEIVWDYANIILDNSKELRVRFKAKEFEQLVQSAFGQMLVALDVDRPRSEAVIDAKEKIEARIQSEIDTSGQKLEMILGCDLFESVDGYPISVGPVVFQTRDQWCELEFQLGRISSTTSRRLRKYWMGKKLKKRKPSRDSVKEDSIIDAIGTRPIVCTIQSDGLSSKMVEEKSLLAARLAICALSLMWSRPSEGMRSMTLLYDGEVFHRSYAVLGDNGRFGSFSSISQSPGGARTDKQFLVEMQQYVGIYDLLGEVLYSYVQPNHTSSRPDVLNALFISLWWFYEACNASSDQIATTKFAACLDSLTGGKKQSGIEKLIEARIGPKPSEQLMKDGRTTRMVISALYGDGRSRLIHGSSEDYVYDWTKQRLTSESVARLCLIQVIAWLSINPSICNLEKILEP